MTKQDGSTERLLRSRLLPFVLLLLLSSGAPAADSTARAVFDQAGVRRGLFLVVGGWAEMAVDLAQAEAVLVHLLVPGRTVPTVREQLVAAGVHGQVTVAAYDGSSRLPVADNLAAVVIVDGDAHPRLPAGEPLRVLRPLGTALIGNNGNWKTTRKLRPDEIDDWPQYFHDAANSDLSQDLRAGPAHGLQWEAGPHHMTKIGVRVVGDVWLGVDQGGLVARDAFSGLPRWRRADVDIDNRFAFLADEKRVYYYPRSEHWAPPAVAMEVLDLATGKDLMTLAQGVTLDAAGWRRGEHDLGSFRKEFPTDWKSRLERATKNANTLQARLAEGVLVQVATGEMVALEAATGKRLWRVTSRNEHRWHHPLIHEGRVYAVAGEGAPSWSYTHWPMGAVRSVHAFDLRTGKSAWRWDWPSDLGDGMAAYNMVISERWLAMAMRTQVTAKSAAAVLLVDRKSGKEHRLLSDTTYGNRSVGGGHSHLRLLAAGNKLWINSAIGQHGSADPADPGDPDRWMTRYNRLPRPVGCTVWRATPNWLFGSLSVYALDGNTIHHTNVTRTACDVGAFPAAGMSFITPNHCFCQPYLPGFNAFHPRVFGGEEEIERLERGKARPAAGQGSEGWPMFLANVRRGAWVEEAIPNRLEQLWQIEPTKDDPRNEMLAVEWSGNWYTQGPLTGISVSAGVAVVAVADRQQILAIDPASGEELWRTTVDGRVDSNPTIRQGVVYVGTRTGWVYALGCDTGELLWRFFAAPRRERVVSFGQLESPWPLHGSVLVDDDGVWAIAGRHNDLDGGLWWWNLDPLTGQPRASGRLGADELRHTTGGSGATEATDTVRHNGANTPAVSNGELVLLAGVWLQKRDGKLVPWDGLSANNEQDRWTVRFPLDILVPGNQGLLNRSEDLGGYKMSYYGFTQAPFFAYRGNDFLTVSGTTKLEHRGGGRDRRSAVRRFRKYDSLTQKETAGRKHAYGAEVVWETVCSEADKGGLKALAVAGASVLIGFSVDNRDHWRDRDEMPHRLRVLDLADGQPRQDDLPLTAAPVQGGISAADGRVYVVGTDGAVTCFGAAQDQ